ncbi:hypothetical protein B0H11DRAFT_1710049 [Mycena galericulata]|nr:hypothetical protein B0H11DRAFT_1710049 [Mycena galericulata]
MTRQANWCISLRVGTSPCGLWCTSAPTDLFLLLIVRHRNSSSASSTLHDLYTAAFEGTPDTLRMAMVSPQTVNGVLSMWYGAGGSSVLGYSDIPTIGIIPQPDSLWALAVDGGWSKLDVDMVVTQINVILRLISALDQKFVAGEL